MPALPTRRVLPALFCAAALAGCGGGSPIAPLPSPVSVPPAPPPTPPAAPALTASTDALALMVSGQARHIVITNVGGQDALNLVAATTTALPAGTGFTTDCATLAPGASCTLTVTPGTTPSATPGDPAPLPAEMGLSGSNTNTLVLSIWVLGFGSVYQGGYVFDLNDSTPVTNGVGGKVVALQDVPGMTRPWGPNDSATTLGPSLTDGAANTAAIVNQYGPSTIAGSTHDYPAWACSNADDAGFDDWYLPAICEMGYDGSAYGSGCGTADAPLMPNIQSGLVDRGQANLQPDVSYWSSTSTSPAEVWVHGFGTAPALRSLQFMDLFAGAQFARCVRTLTP